MEKLPIVYKEPIAEITIKSNLSNTRYYKVCFGEVDWKQNGNKVLAAYVRVMLLKDGEMRYENYSAHMLVTPGKDGRSDFDNLMEALAELKHEYLT
jgi:hypothetical protein